MENDEWHRIDIPLIANLVGFRAEARSGDALDLTDDPRANIFVRNDGDRWSADSFLGFFLKKKNASIDDYTPPDLVLNESAEVEFSVDINPPGTFHVETESGPVDIGRVVPRVEFRRIIH